MQPNAAQPAGAHVLTRQRAELRHRPEAECPFPEKETRDADGSPGSSKPPGGRAADRADDARKAIRPADTDRDADRRRKSCSW